MSRKRRPGRPQELDGRFGTLSAEDNAMTVKHDNGYFGNRAQVKLFYANTFETDNGF
jgi:hypothetical protein